MSIRNLVVVLGDQLSADSAAFDGFDPDQDVVWMAEVDDESKHVWTHKARIVMFLAAMRHFRDALIQRGIEVDYREINARGNKHSLAEELRRAIKKRKPDSVVMVQPGEWRVQNSLTALCQEVGIALDQRVDRHFLSTAEEFADHAKGRKQLRLEYFYRDLRRKHDILIEGGKPIGGKWNYDAANRGSFGKKGPGKIPRSKAFAPDATTQAVIDLVNRRFADHPGELADFDWPVTPDDASVALDDFIANRLIRFGEYQDAMWTDEPYLYHSRLSAAMNLKLIDPREVIAAAVAAFREDLAPLNAVEGFVRQILGWREYVRAIYWHFMPDYVERNELDAGLSLPDFYWTGDTEMNCLHQTITQTLQHGYAHHIQRLMVTGLFSLMLGVDPKEVHRWYLAVYVDAVEWVELPNTLGMSQFADGGVMASKPYVATGKYIQRMSNYCSGCRFDPAKATGEDACPFTTLYWDFLQRHKQEMSSNNRMSLQVRNLDRKSKKELGQIQEQANRLRQQSSVQGD